MMHEVTAGGAIFAHLKTLGVDYVFVNSGTDFPPIIEGLIQARQNGIELPHAIVISHEHVAVGMAHGFFQLTGRAQAVMLHTNVGLANGATGLINAACDQIPMVVMSGRTPVTEAGRFGARTVPIGWGQEMFDQTALVREACKWDYELRFPEQIAGALDRGWMVANSVPRGPVYLSLPREVLCEPYPDGAPGGGSAQSPPMIGPDPEALSEAAKLLAAAENPLVIAQRGAGSAATFSAFTAFCESWALPVSHYWANQIAVSMQSPIHVDWSPDELLRKADVVLVVDALAPWWPDRATPAADAKIIQIGPDPLFARTTPMRSFRSDLTIAGDTARILNALMTEMDKYEQNESRIAARRKAVEVISADARRKVIRQAEAGCGSPMTKDWVSLCLGRAIADKKASIFHELGCPLPPLMLSEHHSYFQEPHSGGLGWGFPAAMGAQIADRDRLVFATMGDGSYMFANPVACHQVCEALDLPVIALILNNEEWGAVRRSATGLYPSGLAAQANDVPLTSLTPSPDFTKTAEASRAHAETITDGADLPAALDRAIKIASRERRQVLLNIMVQKDP